MKVLIDISHPAHVHFYRHLRERLVGSGADVLVIAREKDVTTSLLDAYEIPSLVVGQSGHEGWRGQAAELLARVRFIVRHGREFEPDVVLTRNPSGAQAARLLGSFGIFDTDDGRSVGIHYWASAPIAHLITAPDCLPESFGSKERRYPSYKSLAYLHPDVFTPDESITGSLGLEAGQMYSVLRLVAHDASHDRNAYGIDPSAVRRITRELERLGPVFVTSEAALGYGVEARDLPSRPEQIHDVLAHAAIVVGDSQTVITEAALLGTPAIRINSWYDASPHITQLEERYGLAFSYSPDDLDAALAQVNWALDQPIEEWGRRRERMLGDKVNLSEWYLNLVEEVAG